MESQTRGRNKRELELFWLTQKGRDLVTGLLFSTIELSWNKRNTKISE